MSEPISTGMVSVRPSLLSHVQFALRDVPARLAMAAQSGRGDDDLAYAVGRLSQAVHLLAQIEMERQVKDRLAELDGTRTSRVSALSRLGGNEIDELGGVGEKRTER